MHPLQHDQTYFVLFLGLLFGGETVFVPALYWALIGKLALVPLLITATAATILSDGAWFMVGRFLPAERIARIEFLGRKWPQLFFSTSKLFREHGVAAIVISKYVYGARIAVQMLAGLNRLGFKRYLTVNTASVLLWLGSLLALGMLASKSVDALHLGIHRAYLILGIFIPAALLARAATRHVANRIASIEMEPGRGSDGLPAAVSAIVPAYNEAGTIEGVIQALADHPAIDDIIVVDDGSSDDTATKVQTSGATLFRFEANQGKARAMAKGVELARHETIFFLDADLHGLNSETIDALVKPVLYGEYDMFVAIRDRRQSLLNKIVYFSPILGGERVLRKSLWREIPSWCVQSFQIEIALNYFSKRSGGRMGFSLMPGLTHVKKEKKRGFWPGVAARVRMYAELVEIAFKLYVVHSIKRTFLRVNPQHST